MSEIKIKKTENLKQYKKDWLKRNMATWYRKIKCDLCNVEFMNSSKSNHLKSTKHKYEKLKIENNKLSKIKDIVNL